MRVARKRVFHVSVGGRESWKEDAGSRTVLEVQHQLATESFPGQFVRVIEQYIGGAVGKRSNVEDEDDLD